MRIGGSSAIFSGFERDGEVGKVRRWTRIWERETVRWPLVAANHASGPLSLSRIIRGMLVVEVHSI